MFWERKKLSWWRLTMIISPWLVSRIRILKQLVLLEISSWPSIQAVWAFTCHTWLNTLDKKLTPRSHGMISWIFAHSKLINSNWILTVHWAASEICLPDQSKQMDPKDDHHEINSYLKLTLVDLESTQLRLSRLSSLNGCGAAIEKNLD